MKAMVLGAVALIFGLCLSLVAIGMYGFFEQYRAYQTAVEMKKGAFER